MQFAIQYSWLIPLLPIIGAIVAGFFGDLLLKGKAHWPIWISVGCSAILSLSILFGMIHNPDAAGRINPAIFYDWIHAGGFSAPIEFFFDPLTAIMLCVVTCIGLIITIFSAGYMKGEEGYSRFFAYLGLFIFAMTCLVMANNLVLMFLGWEGVGLCSYLLIGYYYQRPSAAAAAKKAFIVNRIGDFGFLVGIMLCFYAFNTTSFFGGGNGKGLLEMAKTALLSSDMNFSIAQQQYFLKFIPFCLMLGAFGKSAQFPLYVWLPDAMEGPTPVSALIHAATMVTAGVYMIARCGTLFVGNSAALTTITVVGAFTAFFAATIALRQFDLKKVFAYSTISQLGYMFVALGILAPAAGIFHLITHAFFKALLFLSSGVVMHAMLGHLDMRKMSGLKHVLPKTRWVMLIGCAALAGFPFTSGFFSKDEIVGASWGQNKVLWFVLALTAFLTAHYTFRLYFRVFEGPLLQPTVPADQDPTASPGQHAAVDKGAAHAEEPGHHHDHEPAILMVPLILLAIGAIIVGLFVVRSGQLESFLGNSPSFKLAYEVAMHVSPAKVDPVMFGKPEVHPSDTIIPWSMLAGGVISILGILLAYLLHLKDRGKAEEVADSFEPFTALVENKYLIDELYDAIIVKPMEHLSRVFFAIDKMVIDTIVWMIGYVPTLGGFVMKISVQRGYLQGYAAAMLFGVLAVLLLVFL